jgi:hypothetical protein
MQELYKKKNTKIDKHCSHTKKKYGVIIQFLIIHFDLQSFILGD